MAQTGVTPVLSGHSLVSADHGTKRAWDSPKRSETGLPLSSDPFTERNGLVDNNETGVERYDRALEEASELTALRAQLEAIDFPISKADLLAQLNTDVLPEEVLARLRSTDTDVFHSVDHVLANTQASF
jgi:hypothetical protein